MYLPLCYKLNMSFAEKEALKKRPFPQNILNPTNIVAISQYVERPCQAHIFFRVSVSLT